MKAVQILEFSSNKTDKILKAGIKSKRIWFGWYTVHYEGEELSPETIVSVKRNPAGEVHIKDLAKWAGDKNQKEYDRGLITDW